MDVGKGGLRQGLGSNCTERGGEAGVEHKRGDEKMERCCKPEENCTQAITWPRMRSASKILQKIQYWYFTYFITIQMLNSIL